MTGDALLDDLDASQRSAVVATGAPLAILAPAGSGKTRVLTRRIAWRARERLLSGRHVLAVTFTRKAAGELALRLARLGVHDQVTAGTFHALALAQLRRHSADRGREPPAVLDRKGRVLAPLLGLDGPQAALAINEVAGEIEWAKARMFGPDAYVEAAQRAGRRVARPLPAVADLYARYETEKRRRRVLDFDDLLWSCAELVERDPDVAAAQRWRFRHLFVDEFQDASPLQVRLLRAWLGDGDDCCVVGDVAQAIYSFAGADARYLADFTRHFPGAEVIALERNYRSTPQVVRTSSAVLGGESGVQRASPVALRDDGPSPSFTAYPDEVAEARGVAHRLRAARAGGVRWRDMAVLFRTNAQSAAFEEALRRAAVPYRVTGSGRFAARPEVRVLLRGLREADAASPGRAFAHHLADLAADEFPDANDDTRAHRDALVRLGRDYLASDGGAGTVAGFVAWLDLAEREGPEPSAEGVELATFHKAKGLEWDVVCVTGVEAGLVPISHASEPAARGEEQRLLHVALSRAATHLHVSWARTRTVAGRPARRAPSPWLAALEAAVVPGPVDRVPDPRAELAAVRRALAGRNPPQPARPARGSR